MTAIRQSRQILDGRPRRRIGWIFGLLCLALPGGARDVSAAEVVDYGRQVKPLLRQRCYACHGALKQKANLRVDTSALLRKGGDGGPVVEPGRSAESELISRVTESNLALRMPPEGEALSAEQIGMLRAWIDQGAKGPESEAPESDPKAHWAFQKPIRPAVPSIDSPRMRNPVDAFLAREQRPLGLEPLPEAEPRVLLRRVYLNLIGLPPTRQEMNEFLNDSSDDAYEKVVDRLLASPHHGERWGRHWMDVWRYSDWYGRRAVPDVTNSYAMIWRWRDWIVRSLNEDKGYDRMISQMLASDETDAGIDDEAAATGFLLRNFYRWNYNTWMKDNVEHTSKAFLGLTLQCAHCHDHKYDPMTQVDYFAFRAIFEPLEVRHDRVPGEPDPGPYPKYVYGAAYKPITSGLTRVFDEKLDAQTFLYTRGESRNIVPGRAPIAPGPPKFLGGSFEVKPVALPADVAQPALKPFIREEGRAGREKSRSTATATLALARSESESSDAALRQAERAWKAARPALAFAGRDDLPAFARGPVAPPASLPAARDKAEADRLSLGVAMAALTVTEADIGAIRALLDAADARFGKTSGNAVALAAEAAKAGRSLATARADLERTQAEQAVASARVKARAAKIVQSDEMTKALARLDAARKAIDAVPKAGLKGEPDDSALGPVYPSSSTGRRSALARWLTARDNPLTARVAVNHIWRRHFQQPLVPSTADFGRNGKPPTHPQLLDWLAVELIEPSSAGVKPWSMKAIHRLLVTSSAYRAASHVSGEQRSTEVLNLERSMYCRFTAARIESEVVRDGLLTVAGTLDRTLGGADIPYDQGLTSRRRSLYFTHHGEARMPFLELFDAPDACEAYTRTVTVVPQQALALVNNELARSLSRRLADRLWVEAGSGEVFVSLAFEEVLGREPSAREREISLAFLTRGAANSAGNAPSRNREDLVLALFNHNDFLTVH